MAAVSVEGEMLGQIGRGLCVFVGIASDDTDEQMARMAEKLLKLRVFSDAEDKLNLAVGEVDGQILLISQFTLYGDTSKGNRPSFIQAARPEQALPLFTSFMENVAASGITVATGRFGADMKVMVANDGPVTLILDS